MFSCWDKYFKENYLLDFSFPKIIMWLVVLQLPVLSVSVSSSVSLCFILSNGSCAFLFLLVSIAISQSSSVFVYLFLYLFNSLPSISLHFLVFDYNLFPSIHRFILFFFTGVFSRDLSSLTLSVSCKYFMRWHFHTSVSESYLFILTVNLSIILPISYFSLDLNISLVNFDFHLGLCF